MSARAATGGTPLVPIARLGGIGTRAAGLVLAVVGTQLIGVLTGGIAPTGLFVKAAINGLTVAVLAATLILVYRAQRILNFAVPGLALAAAGLAVPLLVIWDWSWYLAAPVAVLFTGVAGFVAELLLIRRFSRSPRLVLTVVTIALGQALVALSIDPEIGIPRLFIHPDEFPLPERIVTPFHGTAFSVGSIAIGGDHVFAAGVSLAALGGLALLLRTRLGIAIRGAASNEDRAASLGVNLRAVTATIWVITGAAAGLVAVLRLGMFSGDVDSLTAVSAALPGGLIVRALVAAVIGRMRDIPTAAVAAVCIGLLEQTVIWGFEDVAITDAFLLGIVIVAFLAQRRRAGRFDQDPDTEWRAADTIAPTPAVLADRPEVRGARRRLLIVAGLALVALPWPLSSSQTNTLSEYVIMAIVAVSLVLLTGWGGQISLGQFAFVGIGASVGGTLTARWGMPFAVALIVGALAGATLAVVIGLPALRVRGLHLAVTTFVFALAVSGVFLNRRYFPGWLPSSVDRPQFLWVSTEGERAFYYLALIVLLLAIVAARGLRASRSGRALIALRDNELAVQTFSVNLLRTRLWTFALSGFLAATAGVLYAYHQHSVLPGNFGVDRSIQIFLAAVVGGLGGVATALTGVVFLALTTLMLPSSSHQLLASAVGLLVILTLAPNGIGSLLFRVRDIWLARLAARLGMEPVGLRDLASTPGGRIPLEPNETPDGQAVEVPFRYRIETRVGSFGDSQRGSGWTF